MPIRTLVSTDGSESSRHAEQFAARLASSLPLELVLAHVINLAKLEYKMIPDFQVDMIHEGARRSAEGLLEREGDFFRANGVEVTPRLLVGEPGPSLCDFAQREKVELVVMGRRGHGDLQDLLFGSVSNHVLHHCHVPVLIVKQVTREEEPEGVVRPLRALVAVDGSEASQRCLDFLVQEAEARAGLQLGLIHVLNPDRPELEHLPSEDRYEALRSLHQQAEALLQVSAERLRSAGFTVDTRVEEGTAGKTLCRVQQEDDYDFIALGRRGLSEISEVLFGSVCHYATHHCAGHVLVVP